MTYVALAVLIVAALFFRGAWRAVTRPRLDQYCFLNALFAAFFGALAFFLSLLILILAQVFT